MAQVRQERGEGRKKDLCAQTQQRERGSCQIQITNWGKRVLFEKKNIMVIPDPTKSKAV